jgi:hypothetical protein
VNHVATDEA